MSFYTLIYSSLGMSAFSEIHKKVVKIIEICGFSREGVGSGLGLHFGWISRAFWEQLVHKIGKKAIQKL